jgi:peptide chain release factor subunit 1
MFDQEQLQSLLELDLNGEKIVSLYLDADNTQEPIETIKLRVRSMLRDANLSQTDGSLEIERYLDHRYDWSKPGLAIFTSTNGSFFRAYPTAVAYRNRLRIGHRPYLKPLMHLLDHYASYGVVLIDKVGARYFEYHLGELQSSDGFMGEEVHKLKKGGGSSAVGMRGGMGGGRREDELVQRNLREAAASAAEFFTGKRIRRLFLGGSAETVAQFRELLTKKLQSKLAGTFTMDMTAGEHEVTKKTLQLLAEANAKRESALVDRLFATHAQGGNAVAGLDDTLQAVSDRRVETLIISDSYREPGYVHPESGLVVANLIRSPLGNDELTEVEDVVEVAMTQAIAQGGNVEVVTENPALQRIGNIGALLRF